MDADATAYIPRVQDPPKDDAPTQSFGVVPAIDEWDPSKGIPPETPTHHRRKRSRWMTALVVAGVLIVVCSGVAAILAVTVANRYEDKVARDDILSEVPKADPGGRWDNGPLNFLVLGSDSRAEGAAPIDDPDGSRSDTIMVVHINADHQGAFIFSIPRDSYVNVPAGG